MKPSYAVAGAAALAAALWLTTAPAPPPVPAVPPITPPPARPARPCPCPGPNCPARPMPRAVEGAGQAQAEPQVDLLAMPANCRRANILSRGLGCCTFRSAEWAAHWQQVPALYDFPEWLRAKGIPGGGTPQIQADLVRRIASERKAAVPPFVQYEGRDPSIIELALKTGRVPCVTWGGNHMLAAVHLDAQRAAILDNNAPEQVQWMSRQQFLAQWTTGGGGWCFVLLAPPPPPPPAGRSVRECKEPCCRCGCGGAGGPRCRCRAIDVRMVPLPPALPKLEVPPPEPPGPKRVVGSIAWHYGGTERYTLGEESASRAEVASALSDDGGKLHLTLIGAPAQRAAVRRQLPDVGRYLYQEYDPGHWALGCGHLGTARLYLQDRAGRVLLRADDEANIAERLRQADPSYRPEADPGTAPPLAPPGLRELLPYLPWALGAFAVVLLLMSMRPATVTPPPATPPPVTPPPPATPATPALSATDQAALEIGRATIAEALKKRTL